MQMKKIYFLLLWIPIGIKAQDTVHTLDQSVVEGIMGESREDQDAQMQGEALEYLLSHPVSLIHPRYDELLNVPHVSPLLAESIIRFTDTVTITNISQLMYVSLMTPALLEKISPFITLEQLQEDDHRWSLLPVEAVSRTRIERRLQITKGYAQGKYGGDNNALYQRLRFGNEIYELAGVTEKDAGENYHNAFVSGYLHVRDQSFVEDLVVGNYTIASSQGLVLSRNMKPVKGAETAGQPMLKGKYITPVVSTEEFRYFQGAAVRLHFGSMTVMGFYSGRNLPATVDPAGTVTSLYTSGIFRTRDELGKVKSLYERTAGGVVEFSSDGKASVVMTTMNVTYSKLLSSNVLDLHGKRSLNAGSVAWHLPLSGVSTYGEVATNNGETFSQSMGAIINISKSFSAGYHHRSYSQGYVSPFAHPFGELSTISDGEQGEYLGIQCMVENASVSMYVDQFRRPDRSDGFMLTGKEVFFRCAIPVTPSYESLVQIRRNLSSGVDERVQTNYRIMNIVKPITRLTISHRIEIITVAHSLQVRNENGLLTFLEGSFTNRGSGFRLKSRIIFFDTDSYDSRVYQYESDVAGNFSNPPLYGKGIRWYLVAGYEIFNNFSVSLKYSETKKLNETVLGGGDEEIRGNTESRFAVQLDFQM